MDSQDYCEVALKVDSEEQAEIIEAMVVDLGFDSFQFEEGDEPVLRCYIQTSLFDGNALEDALWPAFRGSKADGASGSWRLPTGTRNGRKPDSRLSRSVGSGSALPDRKRPVTGSMEKV